MFRNKADQRYFDKVFTRVLSRKTPYYHRNLLVNDKPTNFRIIKIKRRQDVLEAVGGYTSLPSYVCYLIGHIKTFSTLAFKSSVDIVLLNNAWKVLALRPNSLKDKIIPTPKRTDMVLILPIGSIQYLKIQENDIVRA